MGHAPTNARFYLWTNCEPERNHTLRSYKACYAEVHFYQATVRCQSVELYRFRWLSTGQ